MSENTYKRCHEDHCCYFKQFNNFFIILLLYVDDMLVTRSNMEKINSLKRELSKEFEMKDLGMAKQILEMQISWDRETQTLKLFQFEYVEKVLDRFKMKEAKPMDLF